MVAKTKPEASRQVFIDTNILLDFLLGRPRAKKAKAAMADSDIFVSPLSIATAYYVASKQVGFDAGQFYEALEPLRVVTIDGGILQRAYLLAGDTYDLEDAIQVAACLQSNLGLLLTADAQLEKQYRKYLHIEFVQ